MLTYPAIDPVLVTIGPLVIRWYGIMYLLGISGGFWLAKDLFIKRCGLTMDQLLNTMSIIVLSVVLGGRLGYILFYNLGFYLAHPASILAVWQGGMSYHGGAIGCVIGMSIVARQYQVNWRCLLDALGLGSTVGLCLGRIANFINAELYGRVTNSYLGMIFPGAGSAPRHPSQLYEAALEGVVLGAVLLCLSRRFPQLKPGLLFCVYLIGYGTFRWLLEWVREPDAHLGTVLGPLSMGQLLCTVMIIWGIVWARLLIKRSPNGWME
ncbi:prolipoprotein diacylglyceryl transferase [bacterium]|jgi:phosphatidylglycerol---prolipoprotein diacylglyceryl transferase|nr:prolipoprotein diacylglyceryl transferase [bacterium]